MWSYEDNISLAVTLLLVLSMTALPMASQGEQVLPIFQARLVVATKYCLTSAGPQLKHKHQPVIRPRRQPLAIVRISAQTGDMGEYCCVPSQVASLRCSLCETAPDQLDLLASLLTMHQSLTQRTAMKQVTHKLHVLLHE